MLQYICWLQWMLPRQKFYPCKQLLLVDLLDLGAGVVAAGIGTRHAARHTARHAARGAASGIQLLHDRVRDALDLLLLLLELLLLGGLVSVKPADDLVSLGGVTLSRSCRSRLRRPCLPC